jgi:peptidoglycan/xylan/chitin deacetylase (PgdA/CDA1 family)
MRIIIGGMMKGRSAAKVAYLTIDDAPSVGMKEKADFLASGGIPAIWFCSGQMLEKRPEHAAHAIREGFVIGNHGYSHARFSSLSLERCMEEIRKTDRIIDDVYAMAGAARPARLFRFPYGDKGGQGLRNAAARGRKERIQGFLRSMGYAQPDFSGITYGYYRKAGYPEDADVQWTYDVMEWAIGRPLSGIRSMEDVLRRMDRDAPERGMGLNCPGSEDIVLIHDHPGPSRVFRAVIERLIAKGICFRMPRLK